VKNKLVVIIGARPQFIKHFPLEKEMVKEFEVITVHTGQHYDSNMSQVFFDQLGMRKPNYLLEVGSGTHGLQTAKMIIEIEKICVEEQPQAMVVYGDTNSTLAGALVASKLHIPEVHVEAGLRSYNKIMPEEVNRIITDHVSQLLLVPSISAQENLHTEGIRDGVHVVGDIMKDLVKFVKDENLSIKPKAIDPYIYVTLHRPYNVDDETRLLKILNAINSLNRKVVFAAHPRTVNRINEFKIEESEFANIDLIPPQGYLENFGLLENCEVLITDSGGMQKEAYWLKTKCITIRSETEWIETLDSNANTLLFDDFSILEHIVNDSAISWDNSLYGNGQTANQIVNLILNKLDKTDV